MIRYLAGLVAALAILSTPANAQERPIGILKVCKVTAPGIPLPATFHFTVNGNAVTVPVPPNPPASGTCSLPVAVPVGTPFPVSEAVPAGEVLTAVTVSAPATGTWSVPVFGPANASAMVTAPAGVTTVTFRNEPRKMGYLEICKYVFPAYDGPPGSLNFTFSFSPAISPPITVTANSCSTPAQVPSGPVVVSETPSQPGYVWTNCAVWVGGVSTPCTPTGNTANITVVPSGGVSGETLLLVINQRKGGPVPNDSEMQQMMMMSARTPS